MSIFMEPEGVLSHCKYRVSNSISLAKKTRPCCLSRGTVSCLGILLGRLPLLVGRTRLRRFFCKGLTDPLAYNVVGSLPCATSSRIVSALLWVVPPGKIHSEACWTLEPVIRFLERFAEFSNCWSANLTNGLCCLPFARRCCL
jgi:hypothetical protein